MDNIDSKSVDELKKLLDDENAFKAFLAERKSGNHDLKDEIISENLNVSDLSLKKEKQITELVDKINEVQNEIDNLYEIVKSNAQGDQVFNIQKRELIQHVSLYMNRIAEESSSIETQLKNNEISLDSFTNVYMTLRKKFHRIQFIHDKLISGLAV